MIHGLLQAVRYALRQLRKALGFTTVAVLTLALASSRVLHGFLFGLNRTNPPSLIAAVLTLGTVAAFAGLIPARRASKIDPMVALRYE